MVTEQTIIDQETPQAPEPTVKLEDVMAEVQKLGNRVGYLQRKIDTTPAGQQIDPALRAELTEVKTRLEEWSEDRLAQLPEEDQIAHYKSKAAKAADDAAKAGQAKPYAQAQLQGAVDDYAMDVLDPWTEDFCQAGGISLTPEMKGHLKTLQLNINPYTLAVNPKTYFADATKYLNEQATAQRAKATEETPADQAGRALGDGSRASGGPGRKSHPNWLDPKVSFDEMYDSDKP